MNQSRLFLADLIEWGLAVCMQWVPLVTGGVVTAVILVDQRLRHSSANWASGAWLYIAFFVASYLAWRKEHNAVQAELRDRPLFSGYIDVVQQSGTLETQPGAYVAAGFGPNDKVSSVTILTQVQNRGTPSVLSFERAEANDVTGAPMRCKTHDHQGGWLPYPPHPAMNIYEAQTTPITRGDGAKIYVGVLIGGDNALDEASIKTYFRDVEGVEFCCGAKRG